MDQTSTIQSQIFMPDALLQPYISAYLFNEVTVKNEQQPIDLFPVGHCVLSFSFDNLPLFFEDQPVISNFNITGQLLRSFRMRSVKGHYKTIMVLLKPYGAYKLLGVPQSQLLNVYEDLHHISPSFTPVGKKLSKDKFDLTTTLKTIESWLLDCLAQSTSSEKMDVVEKMCNAMTAKNGNASLSELYEASGVSSSSIERYFKEIVGVNPKVLNRIIRFNYAYNTICSGNYKSWIDIVTEHGYFDQAHFIKEFKSFCGYTPSQLHQSTLSIAGHVKNIEIDGK